MSVSVVIPLYNGAPWIGEALDSVLAQTLPPQEIIVVDDGSTDGSPDLVRAYPSVKLVLNEGKGSSVARNIGLRHVRSSYVAFLDQDDLWHPSHLRIMIDTLEDQPTANTAVAAASCFSGLAPHYDVSSGTVGRLDPWRWYPFTIGVEGPSVAVHRTEALPGVGLWEECATGMGDALIFLKLATLHPLLRAAERTVGKRIHASQQWLQVRELGVSYLGFRHQVMSRALDFRRRNAPEDPELPRYSRRLEALRTLQRLTAAIESERFDDVAPIARELEARIGGDPMEYSPHAFYCLMGALFKIYDAAVLREQRDEIFSRLLDYWPDDAAVTRRAIESVIGEQPLVS
jgi:glycosyltransferase involved in cell wall biosynthesis